jgi:cytochrome P450
LITFGHGTHACPGRFFASAEIKAIMAHLLQHYDIKMPEGRGRAENVFKPGGYGPKPEETVLLRRRKAE